jgi:CHASE3 domain sensor protein/GAF domain-containing protein
MSNISSTTNTTKHNWLRNFVNLFQNLKIGQKMILGSIVALVLLVIITALVLINLNALTADFNFLVEHDQPVLFNAARLEKLTVDMETGLRGFVITGKDEFLEPYNNGQAEFDQLLEAEKVLVSDNPPQVVRLEEIGRLHDEWTTLAAEPQIAKRRQVNQATITSDALQEILRGGVGKGILDELRGVLDKMESGFRAADNLPAAILTVQIAKDMVDQETGERGFIITGEESFLDPYNAGQKALVGHIAELRKLVADDPTNRARLDQVESLANDWVVQAAEPEIQARRDVDAAPATIADVSAMVQAGTSKKILDESRAIFAEFTAIELELTQQRSEAAKQVNQNLIILAIGLTVLGAVIVLGSGGFIARSITTSLNSLTKGAQTIIDGDLSVEIAVTSKDETGTLANAFNAMTAQLRDLIGTLEARVAERTRNLELAGEVGRTVSQVLALDVMLKDAAELIRKQFDLYYVQVYLVDPSQTNLILQSGTGTVGAELVGRSHRLPLTTASINGRAAIEKKSVVISNTTESPTFKPNPLLPDTRSEMAVPLMIGERVVGVLDMQSEHAGALSADILTAFEAMAGQLAIAIQNATFLAETERSRAEVEAQARRLSRTNWVDYLDAIHKPEESGFVFEQNKISALTGEEQVKENALTAPISVTGEALGNLVVEMEGQSPIAYTSELVNTVAQQVARQIESLRLLDSAERYRAEAEEASRRITREGWKDYRELNAHESLSFIYDLNEVRPFDQAGDQQTETSAFNLPIKVRDETVGKLVVHGLEADNSEALELANAVAERLGAHIETLRQFDETQRSQGELDKRAGQLAAVAEVSSVSAKELDIQKLLEAVVHLTQRKFGLYHAHVFTFNQRTAELQIAACGWKEGDEHEGTHGTTAIPLEQEQSLVARAARDRKAVIVNDVRNEAGWLPNPLLPDTASEMAVPLVIGELVLGVLDVQSDRLNAFTEADANIYTTLASQVSTSLQNARSFALAQTQADRESMLNTISQKIQSATTVEAVLQIAARELGHALNAPLTIAQLGMK